MAGFREGLGKFFGIGQESKKGPVKEEQKPLQKPLGKMPDVAELRAERREKQFDFETSVAEIASKGEDRTVVYNDNEKSLFAVLDGVGSHGSGDIAAKTVAESFRKSVSKVKNFPSEPRQVEALMKEAVLKSHRDLINSPEAQGDLVDSPEQEEHKKMATTLAAMLCYDNKATIVSVGDSRIYRLRDAKLEQLSYEDSITYIIKANGLNIDTGRYSDKDGHGITLNEAVEEAKKKVEFRKLSKENQLTINTVLANHGNETLKRLRSGITQAIIASETVIYPHVLTVDIQNGDEFLITSDGMTDNCSDREIGEKLNKLAGRSSQEKTAVLKDFAKKMQDPKEFPDAIHPANPDDISIIYLKAKAKEQPQEEEITELGAEDLEKVA